VPPPNGAAILSDATRRTTAFLCPSYIPIAAPLFYRLRVKPFKIRMKNLIRKRVAFVLPVFVSATNLTNKKGE